VRLRSNAALLFPMAERPRCDVLDNFGDPRSGSRSHQGADLLATLGQPVYAVADGTLTDQWVAGASNALLSGNAWRLDDANGTYYFYAHLAGFAPGLTEGASVRRGQLIGYVGDTGNPGAGNYHLHFEVHPGGGAAVNPLPLMAMPLVCRVY
jgi:murein DD-endopeptidase MepM/ murein hydrolase activator NlpD